jgi:hypothetical protein
VGHVGVIVTATDQLSFGMRYLFRQQVTINGEVATTQIPTNLALPVTIRVCPGRHAD